MLARFLVDVRMRNKPREQSPLELCVFLRDDCLTVLNVLSSADRPQKVYLMSLVDYLGTSHCHFFCSV